MKHLLLTLLLPLWLIANPTKPQILFIYGTHFSDVKAGHITTHANNNGIDISYKSLKKIQKDNNDSAFTGYDLVILDGVNSSRSKELFESLLANIKTSSQKVMALNVVDKNDTKWRQGLNYEQHKTIHEYLDNGGLKNFKRFGVFMANDVFKLSDKVAKAPILYPKTAIYHPKSPDKMFTSLEEYLAFLDVNATGKSIVAIAMYQGSFSAIDTVLIDETIDKLSKKENIIPVAFYYAYDFGPSKKPIPYMKLLSLDGKFRADAVVFYQMMHQAQKRRKEFEKLGIPIFGGLTYGAGDQKAFEEDKQGISSFMMPFTLSIPETAGVINPMIVAAKDKEDKSTQIIDYQLDSFVERVSAYMNLKTKENADKKLAFFFWNYPSGQNAMGASFLNIPESLSHIFKNLKSEGYSTKDVNASFFTDRVKDMMALWYREVDAEDLLARDLCELYPLDKYNAWFSKLPKDKQAEINAVWGTAEESNMLTEKDGKKYFTIPRMQIGNFIVLPQGARSQDKKEEKASYHNMSTPTSHGYLSVYLYAKEIFGVDAILHMGTHGSQEWMKGKDRGLSVYDSPNLAVGNTPVIYPFIVDDIGEAMQTKRRGSAVSLSHLTPPFSPAGLHDEMAEIHDLMHQYNEMTEGRTKEKTKEQLIALTVEQSFDKELETNSSVDFEKYLIELHDYMAELAVANQPLGMHTYGEELNKHYATLTVMQMLGEGFAKRANEVELDTHAHNHADDSHSHAHNDNAHAHNEPDMQNYKDINSSNPYLIVKDALEGKMHEDEALKPYLEDAVKYYKGITGSLELSNMLKALSGKYVSTSTGGDPIRSPDILPTGRNMYGFDPSKVPTKAAYETGVELTKELIAQYYSKHGVYPDKLAFSLWSIETMRHYGVLEAQILYALGIRPIWKKGGRVVDMEIIPYSELKRPRIDVVISATGLYRDAFSNVMEYLDKAVKKIVDLKEESNFVRRNALALEKELIEDGIDKDQAKLLSSIRIFSNASGTYGTGLASKVMASGTWEDDADMSENYVDRMGFAFGSGIWGEKVANKLYRKNLKGTDAALFSRSSNVYGLLTSDDPFQYLGGIAQAVRNIDGKTPELFITNLRNKDKGKVETIQKFMSKELRTRYLHPQWIEAMQEEGFAGASEIVGLVQNAWGWEVMDPDSLRDDQWQEFVEVYVNDKFDLDMKAFFEKNNPDALAKISERFLEAIRKGYFKTDKETIKKLVETYMEMANKHDVYTDNEKFTEYVKGKAAGYGISTTLPSKAQTAFKSAPTQALGDAAQPEPKVKGQELKEQKNDDKEKDYTYLYFVLFILGLMGLGMLYEARKKV